MGTTRLGIFPSLDNKVMLDMIDKGLVEWFLKRFPPEFFTHVYMDNQSNISNNYILNKSGELTPVNTAQEFQTPFARISITHGNNNQADVFGTDIWNPNQQPGAFSIDTDLTGYRPIYQDPFHSILAVNERTVRAQANFTLTVQTKADQLGLINYLDNFLKMNYVQTIDVPTTLPMHNLLMEYLRACIFKPEIIALDKMLDGSDEQLKFKQEINEMFMSMMYDYSGQHIKPYKIGQKSKDSEGNDFDTKNYSYCYNQINRIYAKFGKYEADDGNKKDGMWESFKVTISCEFDFGNIIGFVTSVPAIIRGTRNNWYLKSSNNQDRENYYHMIQFKEVFKDDRHKVALNPDIWRHFYYERELMMSSVEERFNLIDDIIDMEESPSHYFIAKALIMCIKDQEEFNTLFKTIIYKDDDPLSTNLYEIDEKYNFSVHKCDLSVPYHIDVFINMGVFKAMIDDIRKKLELMNINWWSYFQKNAYYHAHEYGDPTFKWYIDTIKADFQAYFTGATGRNNTKDVNYRYIFNPFESSSHVDRGYRGMGYISHLRVQEGTDDQFIPIKYIQFLTPDPQFQYYIKRDKGHYIAISTDDVESLDDKIFVYIKVGNKYVECDWNKIMIADPAYKYYTYDKKKKAYIYQKDLKYFERIQQYYISKDEYKYPIYDIEPWN